MVKSVFFMAGVAVCMALPAPAQQTSKRIAVQNDWSVFAENNPKECWATSAPTKTVNTRGGKVVSVRRSDILLFVFFRPAENVTGQIAFTGGYSFAGDAPITLKIDGKSYSMSTQGEWAWPPTPADDKAIVDAMRKGNTAIITARSARGTKTEDTFSLLGFTAALEKAKESCS